MPNADDILVPFTQEEKEERGFKPGPYARFVFAPMIPSFVVDLEASLASRQVLVALGRNVGRTYFLNFARIESRYCRVYRGGKY